MAFIKEMSCFDLPILLFYSSCHASTHGLEGNVTQKWMVAMHYLAFTKYVTRDQIVEENCTSIF